MSDNFLLTRPDHQTSLAGSIKEETEFCDLSEVLISPNQLDSFLGVAQDLQVKGQSLLEELRLEVRSPAPGLKPVRVERRDQA